MEENPFTRMLLSPDPGAYAGAVALAAKMGREAFPLLKETFQSGGPAVKESVIKLAGGIDTPQVLPFLKNALLDESFQVRRSAALALKILTGEDHYPAIYKSEIGQHFKRSFWCHFDFIPDEVRAAREKESVRIRKGFAAFFRQLSSRWTYSGGINPTFFSHRRKKNLAMSEDGKALFKNFNYYLEKVISSSRMIQYLLGNIGEVLGAEVREAEEKNDILRCLRLALSSQLGILENGLGGFIAAFHPLRTELNLALDYREGARLTLAEPAWTGEDEKLQDALIRGFIDFEELRTGENLDGQVIAGHLTSLRRILLELSALIEKFAHAPALSGENYLRLKGMGILAHRAAMHNLALLSYWCKND